MTKGTQDPQRYDVDAVLLYSEKGEMTDVFMAVCALQEKGMSVSAQTSEDTELRYREKYVLRDGRLGDVESLGCLGEIHVFTDFQKRIDTEIQHRYRPLFLNHNINLWINKYISFFIMPGL